MRSVFYGWYVIIALVIVGLVASCVRYALPVFMPSFLEDFGWSRTTVGFGFTLNFWMASVPAPLIGILIDRVGGRFVTALGGILILSAMILLSTVTNIMQFYIYFGFIAGLGICCTFYVPLTSITRKWFIRKAGFAVSIALTGAGLGVAIAPPVVRVLIDTFGWRASFLVFGIPSGILCLLVAALIIRNYPESIGLLPDGEVSSTSSTLLEGENCNSAYATTFREQSWRAKDALTTINFWFLDVAYGLSCLGVIAIIAHMVTWAQDLKIDRVSATSALLMLGICSVLFRIVGGMLRDRFGGKLPIYIGMIGLIGMGLYALRVHDQKSFYVCAMISGIFYGLHIPAWTPLLGDLFGRKTLGTLMGVLSLSFGLISGSGAVIFGWIFDNTGTYRLGFVFAVICYIAALILVLMMRPMHHNELNSGALET